MRLRGSQRVVWGKVARVSEKLLRGHARFRWQSLAGERDFLVRLASKGQNPDALFVGCSDSRVVPELLTCSSPGDLFVVRNVANVVPPFQHVDSSVGAAIEYAIAHLKVSHLVVCGHYECGGIRAVLDDDPHVRNLPSLHEWLASVRSPVARARAVDPSTTGNHWRRAVEENVIEQLSNLGTYDVVAHAFEEGRLRLHGWIYDLRSLDLFVYDLEAGRFVRAQNVMSG